MTGFTFHIVNLKHVWYAVKEYYYEFTFHIVNLKQFGQEENNLNDFLFTFHIVNLKLKHVVTLQEHLVNLHSI